MSNPDRHAGTMKTDFLLNYRMNQGEVIAGWGDARLIRHIGGRYQLVGGTAEDQAVVREWISLFAHEIVVTSPPRRGLDSAGPARTEPASSGL